MFDPSLVIGASYQARTVVTTDGRVLTGLVAEDSPQRVVLKMQGGKLETIAGGDVEEMTTSRLSLMPEDLEKQLKPQELADLFAFLTLDKPPQRSGRPQAAGLASRSCRARRPTRRSSPSWSARSRRGFTIAKAGKRGLAIVAEHAGREGVLRTRPVSRQEPCVLRGTFDVPAGKRTRLVLCRFARTGGGLESDGARPTATACTNRWSAATNAEAAWQTISLDLTRAGRQDGETGTHRTARTTASATPAYWGQVEIVSD